MGADRMELRPGRDAIWAGRSTAAVGIAVIAFVAYALAVSGPQRDFGHASTLFMGAGGIVILLGQFVHETIWRTLRPVATVDDRELTYRTPWGLRRICFADVVRAEFALGGQLRLTTSDGRCARIDLW